MAALPDLITTDYASAQFAAGDRILTAAQFAALPSKVAEASAYVRRWCGDRDFTRQTYTRVLTPALDGSVMLHQFPVNRVLRVSAGRSAGITVANSDPTTNSRATVGFTSTGDEATGLTWTGLALSRVASGVTIESDLTFAAYPTLGTLAGAINALGSGWSATVPATLVNWPSADLFGGDVARNAFGTGAALEVFAEDLGDAVRLDRRTGRLSVGLRGGISRIDGPAWGPYQDQGDDWRTGPVLVTYDAGFDLIPTPVQQATAIVAIGLMDKLEVNSSLNREDLGNTDFWLFSPETVSAIPKAARDYLAPYRIVRV